MTKRLNDKYPTANCTMGQLKDREQRLKKNHNIVKSISKSGFGWDPEINMPTAIDDKWKELSEAQQKWRNKPFPYYDDLYDIYDGKVADGKRCRSTSDCHLERDTTNLSSQEDSLHHDIEQEFDMGIEPEFGFGHEDGTGINGTEATYATPTDIPEGTQTNDSVAEGQTLHNSESRGKKQLKKSIGKAPGSEKGRSRKNKDLALDSLVALRKEELESYKELKEKQIESYKQVKLAQMERNDPNNDPYSMSRCIFKLKEIGLPTPEMMKTINYLKKDRLNREIFVSIDIYPVLVELIKEAISHTEN
ncbi:hypothetical protein QOZ80_1AG0020630 [Eleusine coracana subsp. coracana]|nr:hypothetical protein QOZ80_1AG0020630 [Eleusine coracana subsp. coracana]